ncbi:MAG TPA: L,D-transpeptidase [Devosiaceae bacterium]
MVFHSRTVSSALVLLAAIAGLGVSPVLAGASGTGYVYPPPAGMTTTMGKPTNRLMLHMAYGVDPRFLRQVVPYSTTESAGTIVVDTGHKYLFLVLGEGLAMRYGIGVARTGFEWSGTHTVVNKRVWPDWTPPAEMLQRQPGIPTHMAGGPDNPLGARALYIGSTLYRIHGTTEPWTIGHNVSSGCIRLTNEDVIDLYSRVKIGTKVVVF